MNIPSTTPRASTLVRQARSSSKEFPCTVTISKDGKKADASKMFSLMGLGIKGGETIVVTTEGEQEQEAATALQAYLAEIV